MVSQVVLSVLALLIPSGIVCASLSSSSVSSSSSSSGVGSNNAQFGQTQNTIPAPGFGYNYGNFYPSYPIYSSFGSINPGNPVQATASLNSRFGNDVAAPTVAQIPFNPQLYGANSVVAPLDYGQYLNNLRLQQQNALFLQQQQLLQQQQQLQQQALLNNQNPISGSNQAAPSLDSRFSDDSAPTPTGISGIQTSSFSSSSDVNGKKTQQGGTRTVINDNGKIYTL